LRSQTIEKAEAKRRLYSINKNDLSGLNTQEANIQRSLITTANTINNSSSNMNYMKKFKTKEKRKIELVNILAMSFFYLN
jgi:hypothetical protein